MASTLFPQLDRRAAARALREGIRIEEEDAEAWAATGRLEELGIVKLEQGTYVRCASRDDPDRASAPTTGCAGEIELGDPATDHNCPLCGRLVDDLEGKKRHMYVHVRVDPLGARQYLALAIGALPSVRSIQSQTDASFIAALADGRTLTVVLTEFASAKERYSGLYFAEATLYVIVSDYDMPPIDVVEQDNFVLLADIISQPPDWLAKRLELAAEPFPDRPDRATIEQAFDALLASNTWQWFEQAFMPEFFQYLDDHRTEASRYLRRLAKLDGTVFGYFPVAIGGAGRTDLRQISKLGLMNELFAGDGIADAKKYGVSALGTSDVDRVLAHLETDPLRASRAIVFLSTDSVGSAAWERVMQLRNNCGHWKIVVLTKSMLLELISELGAGELLTVT